MLTHPDNRTVFAEKPAIATLIFLESLSDQLTQTLQRSELPSMFRRGVRQFATTALRSAEASTPYHIKVSKAQGVVNGLTEGMFPSFNARP